MIAHDLSKSPYDCPACQRLLQITHDLSKSPSDCPGCVESAVQRMRDERAEKREIAASWDEAMAAINYRNQSPGGV